MEVVVFRRWVMWLGHGSGLYGFMAMERTWVELTYLIYSCISKRQAVQHTQTQKLLQEFTMFHVVSLRFNKQRSPHPHSTVSPLGLLPYPSFSS